MDSSFHAPSEHESGQAIFSPVETSRPEKDSMGYPSLSPATSSEGTSTSGSPAEASGSEEVLPGTWQYIALAIATGTLYTGLMGTLTVLLPQQVSAIAGNAQKVSSLGLVTGIGAIFAVVVPPIAGFLSDRTRSPLGRRNVWVMGGSLVLAILLFAFSHAATIPLLIVLWCAAQTASNAAQSALTAVVPERFPISKRGTISSVSGIGTMLGIFLGTVIAGLSGSLSSSYLVLAVVVLIGGLLYTFTAREPAHVTPALSPSSKASPTKKKLDLPRSADYWWAFAGRFTIFLGYQGVQGYQLYLLTDYIHLGQSNPELKVGAAMVMLSGINIVFMVLSTAISGWLSDKVGKLKIFVFWASLLFAFPMLIILFVPTWPAMLLSTAITGLAFGLYMAVDQALMTRVLPSNENAARDLGILNIANAGPQVMAPFVASLIIASLGGYRTLIIIAIVLAAIASATVRFIRSVN